MKYMRFFGSSRSPRTVTNADCLGTLTLSKANITSLKELGQLQ